MCTVDDDWLQREIGGDALRLGKSFEIGRVTENNNLILVVDDNTDCREIFVMTLRILGYPVISAVDGAEALELAIACRPKLIFMDLSMPNMDGYDASRAIHAHAETRGIPIVALSVNGNETKQRSKALESERVLSASIIFIGQTMLSSWLLCIRRVSESAVWSDQDRSGCTAFSACLREHRVRGRSGLMCAYVG